MPPSNPRSAWLLPLLYLVFLFMLSACDQAPLPPVSTPGGVAPAIPTASLTPPVTEQASRPTPSPTSDLEATERPRGPRFPKYTPRPTATKHPQPTPLPELIWAVGLGEPLILENFIGTWSPTANELAGLWLEEAESSPLEKADRGNIAFFTAPDFTHRLIPPDLWFTFAGAGFDLTWSPDGQHIIFDGPRDGRDETWSIDDNSALWIANRRGQGSHPLQTFDNDYESSQLLGWLDPHTLAVYDYFKRSVDIIDIWKAEEIFGSCIYGDARRPGPFGVPVTFSEYQYYNLGVIPKENPEDWTYEVGCSTIHSSPGTAFHEQPSASRTFEEWVPGLDQILGVESKDNHFSLILWDLKTDTVETIVPDAVDGTFSPDGRWLATLFEDPQYPVQPDPTDAEARAPFKLSLMHWPDKQIAFTTSDVPLFPSPPDDAYFRFVMDGDAGLAFSPDSRYLAYFTLSFSGPDSTSAVLNVLDLQTQSLVASIPSATGVLPLWAPHSDRLVYLDENHNWRLLDILSGQTYAFTQQGGDHLREPAWSFSSSYLSFHQAGTGWPVVNTVIYLIPEELP